MKYAMQVTDTTANFVAKYFNDGVIPEQTPGEMTLIIIDEDGPSKIVTMTQFDGLFGNGWEVVKHSTLFRLM